MIPPRNKRWVTADGVEVPIANMSTSHLVNVIRWLDRQPDEVASIISGGWDEGDGDVEFQEWERDGYTKDEWRAAFSRELNRRRMTAPSKLSESRR